MLDFLKQMNELRKLQDQMKKEIVTVSRGGVTITMNGSMNVQSVTVEPTAYTDELGALVRELFNEATKEIQTRLAGSLRPHA